MRRWRAYYGTQREAEAGSVATRRFSLSTGQPWGFAEDRTVRDEKNLSSPEPRTNIPSSGAFYLVSLLEELCLCRRAVKDLQNNPLLIGDIPTKSCRQQRHKGKHISFEENSRDVE